MKVSVVTPSYNQIKYLKLCAASVADQEGVELEHIIQDAGSDGDLSALLKGKPGIRLFVEQDKGMYDAINRGLRRATGEICAYLNCDEQYLPGTLSKVENFFAANPGIDVLFGDIVLVDQEGQPLSYRRAVLPTREHVRLAHLNTATCATFFRRKILDRGLYFDPQWKAIGDAVWVESLLKNKISMATMHQPLSVFALTQENLGATKASKAEASRWKNHVSNSNFAHLSSVLWHRLRKALAGAYRFRDVAIDIYTLESPDQRQYIVRKRVGFTWPRT